MREEPGKHDPAPFDYDHHWETKWDDMKRLGPSSRHIRRIIREWIRILPFHTLLDVGCGQGSFLAEVLEEFPSVSPAGIDISPAATELAKKRVPSGRFWVLDLEREHLDSTFDLVICSEVLEHLEDDRGALRHLRHMTAGHLILSTLQGRMRSFEASEAGHVRNYASGELVEKVEHAGFRTIQVVQWGFPFFSPLYRDFLELIGARGTTGRFGLFRKLLSFALYQLFALNASTRGDQIFVLAKRRGDV